MKKNLFALAALAAIAGSVQAQSSVTLYGTLDASLQYINNAGTGAAASTTAGNSGPAVAKTTDLNLGYVDSAVASSVWGLRGTEDLGGGLKATFQAESDIVTNNGGMHNAGLFRRAANVGIGGSYGQLDLGLKANPLMVMNNALMPVAGNSVGGSTAYALGYKDDFTRNAVTYTTPHIYGLRAQAQVGLGNTVDDNGGGNVYAGSLVFDGVKDLTVRAAAQRRIAATSTSAANYSTSSTSGQNMFSSTNTTDKTSYLVGASYKWNNLTVAGAWMHNQTSGKNLINVAQFGLGYQVTPTILVGTSYAISTMDSSLLNAQVRYALSKRSSVYAQVGYAHNSSRATKENGAFAPVATTTGAVPAVDIYGYEPKGTSGVNSTSVGVGIIHTF